MKIQDLPIKQLLEERETEKSYLIGNEIINKEYSEDIANINKVLIPLNSFATKEEVSALVEQNSQLVQVINKVLAKYQESERVIQDLKKQIETKSNYQLPDMTEIHEAIAELNTRLDNGIIEF